MRDEAVAAPTGPLLLRLRMTLDCILSPVHPNSYFAGGVFGWMLFRYSVRLVIRFSVNSADSP